jgi:histidinol-phosphate/aromatic aminotransferase/cobyric acid decarboxylase-like protein/CTP:phosphocholine cytidylyltransferase-like protein
LKAIILAAGYGKRMRPFTDTTHKTLLRIGDRTVIQWIVDALVANGVGELVVVTGYMATELQQSIDAAYPDLSITYVHNERYAQTNNIYSISLALNSIEIDSEILLIECDLIFEPNVIRRLLDSPYPNVALVDHYRAGMDGTVVEVADGVITEVIVPRRQGPGFVLEGKFKTLNIYRFSQEFCAGSFKKLLNYYTAVINDNDFYEMVLGIIIFLQQETISAEILTTERWTEIDDPNDINVARFLFDASSRKKTLDESFGGYWNYDVLDFCFLRNMYFPNGAVDSEMRNSLPAVVRNYGSAQGILDAKLAYYLLCQPAPLTVLNGASQVYPVLQAYFEGRKALLPEPTFGEYTRCFPNAVSYRDEGVADLERIAKGAAGCEVVVFVNPNNPTGTLLPSAGIHAYAAAHPQLTVIVDESFIEFSDQPGMVELLERAPLENVIVIKSLSKTLGIPGVRLGYVYTRAAGFRDALRKSLPVWNLNSVAEHFLEVILKHRQAIDSSYRRTMEDREHMARELAACRGVRRVWPSGGNFLLVELHATREECGQMASSILLERGIYVKDISRRFPGDRGFLRLAVRLPHENARVVEALQAVEIPVRERA